MKRIAIVVAVLAIAGCKKEQPATRGASISEKSPAKSPAKSPGEGLRQLQLSLPVEKLGFKPNADFPTVYGVLTEWPTQGMVVTVSSMRDGSASIYMSSGGFLIGGQAYEKVRQAAVRHVKTAEQFAKLGKPDTTFAYPKSDQVFYHLLTYDGVRLVVGDAIEVAMGRDPTAPLFEAAKDVMNKWDLEIKKQKSLPKH